MRTMNASHSAALSESLPRRSTSSAKHFCRRSIGKSGVASSKQSSNSNCHSSSSRVAASSASSGVQFALQ